MTLGLTMNAIRQALVTGTTPTFMGAVFVSTILALSLRPTFMPLVVLVSLLIVYTRATVDRPRFTSKFFILLSVITVAMVAKFSSSTSSAVSTKFLSFGLLLAVATIFSLVALTPIMLYAKARSRVGTVSAVSGLLLFPALWTTTWALFVYISPLGRIGTWTPMNGIEMYSWVMPILGQPGIDYMTALWAVVLAEYLGEWAMGPNYQKTLSDEASPSVDLLTPIECEPEATTNRNSTRPDSRPLQARPAPYLLALLVFATIPSYYGAILPLPTHSPSTTELTVSCVHPYTSTFGTPLTLKDYVHETLVQASRAKVLLWPEGAVRFRSEEERLDTFATITNISTKQNTWIAIGYEQEYSSRDTVRGKHVRGQNVLAIFGPKTEPVTYVKRKLVPLVESFSMEASLDPPPKYSILLPKPNQRPKSDKSWPRTIPITAAICLDVTSPLATAIPVNSTEEDAGRPALILAPARTWHPDIGKAMFAHASMRAVEQGASILWCDGGEGGVSGIGGLAAQGLGPMGGIGQVGTGGSWLQTIGIPYPYDTKHFSPTWYYRWGDFTMLFVSWVLLVVPFAQGLRFIYEAGVNRIRRQGNGHEHNESSPLLSSA